ncbi:MAG: hypothetical protein KF878_01610 [Planctomycetes bacterium]|nr:hypothetical protein [Planctomycetota bacterium]
MTSPPAALKVLDTFLRGLQRLSTLADDLASLEEEVAGHEAEALERVLEQVRPLLPRLARPVVVREPWRADDTEAHRVEGVVLAQNFQQDRAAGGRISHRGDMLLLDAEGALVELTVSGSWTEGPPVTGATWRVESHARAITPALARRALRPALTGLLEAVREAIVRGRADHSELERRLALLREVDEVLGRGA